MYLDDFIQFFSRNIRLDKPLSRSEDGTYWISTDDLDVQIGPMGDGIYFTALVGTLPEAEEKEKAIDYEPLYLVLLIANLFGQGTGSATLSLGSAGKKVILTLPVPYDLPLPEMNEQFEQFLNEADHWVDELENPERLITRLVA